MCSCYGSPGTRNFVDPCHVSLGMAQIPDRRAAVDILIPVTMSILITLLSIGFSASVFALAILVSRSI